MWKVVVVALLALAAVGCGASRYAVASWQYVQAERAAQGLQPLEWDTSLFPLTDERAQYIAAHLNIEHDQAYFDSHKTEHPWACEVTGRQPLVDPGLGRAVPEAIGWGWTQSPGHAGCVLGATYRRAAIGVAMGEDGWIYEVMWLTD
jgi:uncharacterized protein YkwD